MSTLTPPNAVSPSGSPSPTPAAALSRTTSRASSSRASSSLSTHGPNTPILPVAYPRNPPPAANPRAPLTQGEQAVLRRLVAFFADDEFRLPQPQEASFEQDAGGGGEGVDQESLRLMDYEKMWLSEECILRYLRATSWDGDAARTRLTATLVWRREFGLDTMQGEDLSKDMETGVHIIWEYDDFGRPVIYFRPALMTAPYDWEAYTKLIFFNLAQCERLMPPGVDHVVVLLDFADSAPFPPLASTHKIFSLFQAHFPDRLGFATANNLSFVLRSLMRYVVLPLLDPLTRSKVSIDALPPTASFTPASTLLAPFGGEARWPVNNEEQHARYWAGEGGVLRLVRARRDREMRRWTERGGEVGMREWDWKMRREEEEEEDKTEEMGQAM